MCLIPGLQLILTIPRPNTSTRDFIQKMRFHVCRLVSANFQQYLIRDIRFAKPVVVKADSRGAEFIFRNRNGRDKMP